MENRTNKKTPKQKKETLTSALSNVDLDMMTQEIGHAINNRELDRAVDKWLKTSSDDRKINDRDINILNNHISEYMGSFILFGYNLENDRVIVESFKDAKEYDAMMKFLETVFFKYQNQMDDDD